jgi:hypothetical protein
MKKLIFNILLLLFFFNNSYGQLKISMNVYQDSTLNSYLSNVKINLISGKNRECFKIKSLGKFEILIDNPKSIYSIEIKKRRYISLIIEDIKIEGETQYQIGVILKRALSVHDKKYEGVSKLVSIEKDNGSN